MLSKTHNNSQKVSNSSSSQLSSKILLPTSTSTSITEHSKLSNEFESSSRIGSITTTTHNYSQYSLSNKIIVSILKCIINLCKLNYEWKDSGYERSRKGVYHYHHHITNSNPLTENVNLYTLLIIPLLSNLQVSLIEFYHY